MSARRERVIVRRNVEVACVPDGTPAELPAGTLVNTGDLVLTLG